MAKVPKAAVCVYMDEMTKARSLQLSIEESRSLSDMIDWLVKLGLKTYYKGKVEKAITDPRQFIEINGKK